MRVIVALCGLLFATTATLTPGSEPDPFIPFRVLVDARGGEDTTNLVQSYVNRELRALSDVRLVDERPTYIVRVVVVPTTAATGATTGFALSLLVSEGNANDEMRLDAWGIEPRVRPDVLDLLKARETVLILKVYTGDARALQELCRRAAADVDAQVLEPRRKWLREVRARKPQPR
jgi:hypothetical protein